MSSTIKAPELVEGSLVDEKCYLAKKKNTDKLKLPETLIPNWKEEAIRMLGEYVELFRQTKLYMDICVKCGNCSDKCQFFLGSGDPKNMPVARSELLRKIYRRYYTLSGKLFGGWVDAEELTEDVLRDWYTYFYQCSECRRCSVFCPYGIDTADITMAARSIMARIGLNTKYLTEVIDKANAIGNNLGIPPNAWKNSCEFLEEEMKDETGLDIRMQCDVPNCDVLLIVPSADLFVNDMTAIGYAKMFHAAGVSWTYSTHATEAGNYGMFLTYDDMKRVNKRMVDAIRDLKPKRWVMGECGHAWRAAYQFTETLNGPTKDLLPEGPRPQHISEFVVELMKKGAFKIDKSVNDEFLVTMHDPCNLVRAGGITEEPRYMLRQTVNRFVDMPADSIREKTYCCGGGGALLADDIMGVRMAGGKPRAEACRSTGANYLAVPCAICKAQLPEVMKHWNVPAQVGGVIDLLGRALIFGAKEV